MIPPPSPRRFKGLPLLRGFGAPVAKSEALFPLFVQPLPFRTSAVVLLEPVPRLPGSNSPRCRSPQNRRPCFLPASPVERAADICQRHLARAGTHGGAPSCIRRAQVRSTTGTPAPLEPNSTDPAAGVPLSGVVCHDVLVADTYRSVHPVIDTGVEPLFNNSTKVVSIGDPTFLNWKKTKPKRRRRKPTHSSQTNLPGAALIGTARI